MVADPFRQEKKKGAGQASTSPKVLQGQELCDLLKKLLIEGCKDLQVLDQDFNSLRPIMPGRKTEKPSGQQGTHASCQVS